MSQGAHEPYPHEQWSVEEIGCSRVCSSYFVVHREVGEFRVHQYIKNAKGNPKRFRTEDAARAALARLERQRTANAELTGRLRSGSANC